MPSVYLIQYSVSSTETPEKVSYRSEGESFLPLRRKKNGASIRERSWPRWCKAPSASYSPSFLLRVTACPSFYISSNTSSFQRHSSGKSSTLISNFTRSRVPGNKGRGLSISSLLSIAVLNFNSGTYFVPQLGIET